jgi:hypothetical protein
VTVIGRRLANNFARVTSLIGGGGRRRQPGTASIITGAASPWPSSG